jgi:hypothetical protein
MSLAGEELVIDGQTIDAKIAGSITAATLHRRIDGATSLELTIHDPGMDLLRSGALTRPGQPSKRQAVFKQAAWDRFSAARITLDGISFRLAGGTFRYDSQTREVTLTFEDELATLMRLQTRAIKVSRGQETRAEFNGRLVQRALAHADVPFTRALADRYFSPQAGQRSPIKEPDEEGRTKGFAKGKKLKIKTADATAEQKDNLAAALTEADRLKAGERATLALITAGITESRWRDLSMEQSDADSEGVLQVQARTSVGIVPATVVDPRSGSVHGAVQQRTIKRGRLDAHDEAEVARIFLLKGFAAYQHGAIKYAADHPQAEIWEIAQAMQGSGAGRASNGQSNYGPWVEQARDILDAWGGAGGLHTVREAFEFRAGGRRNGKHNNYWDDSGDSAEEVQWRRLCDRNRVWFLPDEWLFERQPVLRIDGSDGPQGLAEQGIISIDTTGFDVGLPTADIIIQCLMPRWGGPPGAVVEVEDLGALDGDWLIASNDQDLRPPTEIATLTLQRPRPQKKEPAPKTNTVQLTETRPEAGSMREKIVHIAERAHRLSANYYYRKARPRHPSLFENELPAGAAGPVQPMGIDCSEFVTLVYKEAEAPDPNGSGYDGSGNTSVLMANGKKTSDPQPGDMVFYRSPEHVGIYIGGGQVIEMGGTPGPLKLKVGYRTDKLGYWTFDLGS